MPSTREQLYQRFRNGQKPDENDFQELIDSSFNIRENPREEIPEVVTNAGWYYFRFFPFYTSRDAQIFSIGEYGTSVYGSIEEVMFPFGYMNIFLPKGVTHINSFALVGDMIKGATDPSIQVTFYKSSIVPNQLEQEETEIIFNENITRTVHGSHPLNEFLPIGISIDPAEDELYLRIIAVPGRPSPESRIFIKHLGIEFT